MKKINKAFTAVICCGVLAVAFAGIAMADPVVQSGVTAQDSDAGPGTGADDDASTWAAAASITGPVMQINDEYILMDSVSDDGSGPVGMVSLRIDPDYTLIVDAADGYPAALSDIKEGDTVCAYTGPAMTLSLPPQISASMVICNIPEDGSVPLFTKAASLSDNGDGTYKLTVAGGDTYSVPADVQVRPYLTRNIVTLSDLTPGSNCLVWHDAQNIVSKIVIIQN